MRRIRSVLAVAALAAPVLTLAGPAVSAPATPDPAPLHPFVRDWIGHTRDLVIASDRTAHESISSGCCDRVIDVRFRLSDPRGDQRHGSVRARVIGVKVHDPKTAGRDRPHVGDVTRFRVRHGVLTEPLTGTNYCNEAAGSRGVCGA